MSTLEHEHVVAPRPRALPPLEEFDDPVTQVVAPNGLRAWLCRVLFLVGFGLVGLGLAPRPVTRATPVTTTTAVAPEGGVTTVTAADPSAPFYSWLQSMPFPAALIVFGGLLRSWKPELRLRTTIDLTERTRDTLRLLGDDTARQPSRRGEQHTDHGGED